MEKYEGFGLTEAVLAIAIVGIVCLSFMGFTIASIIELYRIEQGDKLTREAQLTAEKVRNILVQQNQSSDGGFFPPINNINKCYAIEGDLDSPFFVASEEDTWVADCTYGNWEECRCSTGGCTPAHSSTENIFAVYCLLEHEPDNELIKGVVYTGLIKCQRKTGSGDCVVPDYEMYVYNKLTVETPND